MALNNYISLLNKSFLGCAGMNGNYVKLFPSGKGTVSIALENRKISSLKYFWFRSRKYYWGQFQTFTWKHWRVHRALVASLFLPVIF